MGAQNTKERTGSGNTHSIRTTRNRPKTAKDGRQQISNIFTEHSGMNHLYFSNLFQKVNFSPEVFIDFHPI